MKRKISVVIMQDDVTLLDTICHNETELLTEIGKLIEHLHEEDRDFYCDECCSYQFI